MSLLDEGRWFAAGCFPDELIPLLKWLWQKVHADLSKRADLQRWERWNASLPRAESVNPRESQGAVCLMPKLSQEKEAALRQALLSLSPWRKGPFRLSGIELDSEWRADLKWDRLRPHLSLKGKRVLDVGSNNGYYLFRACLEGARCALGLERSLLYALQFLALSAYAAPLPAAVLPFSFESALPVAAFDVIFNLGVLYHSRNPRSLLNSLHKSLENGGTLILETLLSQGEDLRPQGPYAGMKNVHLIPSETTLRALLEESGFHSIVEISRDWTTPQEQRTTPFSSTPSLQDFLNPNDSRETIEGFQAPLRVAFLMKK